MKTQIVIHHVENALDKLIIDGTIQEGVFRIVFDLSIDKIIYDSELYVLVRDIYFKVEGTPTFTEADFKDRYVIKWLAEHMNEIQHQLEVHRKHRAQCS